MLDQEWELHDRPISMSFITQTADREQTMQETSRIIGYIHNTWLGKKN